MINEKVKEFLSELDDHIQVQEEWICTGQAETYDQYCGVVGLIRGLKESKQILKDVLDGKKEQEEE